MFEMSQPQLDVRVCLFRGGLCCCHAPFTPFCERPLQRCRCRNSWRSHGSIFGPWDGSCFCIT